MNWPLIIVILMIVGWAVGLLYYGVAVPDSQLLGRSLVRGARGGKRVALTFDDGPTPPVTNQILDWLKDAGVTATFFVNGKLADRYPECLQRMVRERHTIGNHTYTHPFLYLKTRGRMACEIDSTQDAVERAAAVRPRLFRCPYGVRWFGLFSLLRERGMVPVQWSDTGFDWVRKNRPGDIARLALDHIDDGAIILLHDGCGRHEPGEVDHTDTLRALPTIVSEIRERGFTFVSVNDFL